MDILSITRPDDWHVHFRDGEVLADLVPHHALRFGRAIAMPNLKPAVTTTRQAQAYRQRLQQATPTGCDFNPLMTLYLTDTTPPEEVIRAQQSGIVQAIKLYPAGATTNSADGVTDMQRVMPTLRTMAEVGMPLLIHAETTAPEVDVFDRETHFMESLLKPLLTQLPELRVVVEHVTTADMADFIVSAGDQVAATLTPQHLLYNRNALLVGGIHPHLFCLPVLKRERHRQRLCDIVANGHPRFFLGTDSAPHTQGAKESGCGCAGIFSGHCAIEIYADIFDGLGALEYLEGFASLHGPAFYGLPPNDDTITLKRDAWPVPESYPMGDQRVIPLLAGSMCRWRMV